MFRVYALDNVPKKPGTTKQDLRSAIKGHALSQGKLIGTYDRNGHTGYRITNEAPVKQGLPALSLRRACSVRRGAGGA